jgi:hypothetical protein
MAKQLNEKNMLNELHGESAFFGPAAVPVQAEKPKRIWTKKKQAQTSRDIGKVQSGQALAEQASQSTQQPVDQSTDESTQEVFDMSPILPRPKSFYITEKQDEDLDILVKKLTKRLEGKIGQKIDRSMVTRLIFEDIGLTREETITRLAGQLTSRLVSQLTS